MVCEENVVIIVILDYGLIVIKYLMDLIGGRYEMYNFFFFIIIFK